MFNPGGIGRAHWLQTRAIAEQRECQEVASSQNVCKTGEGFIVDSTYHCPNLPRASQTLARKRANARQEWQRGGKNRGAEPGLAAQRQESRRRAWTCSAEPGDSQNIDFDAIFAALRAGMFRRRLALRCQPRCNSSLIRNLPLRGSRPPRSRCRSSSTRRSRLQEK